MLGLILGLATGGRLSAQSPPDKFYFALPAQPLIKSLQEFSEVTGVSALGQAALLERRMAPATTGLLTAPQALDRLLGEGNLRYRFTGERTVAIFADERHDPPARGLPRAAAADEIVNLETFTVIARRSAAGEYAWSNSRSATRTDTPLLDVPQAISVVTRDVMGDQAMRSMEDVFRYMPGVGIAQGEGNRDAAVLRGSNSSASFYVDGLRDDADYFRDLYNVERIEALKGPNAMIFGRGGPGGLINRVTKQAGWTPVQEAKIEIGSWQERRATVDAGFVLSDSAAVRFNGLDENADSYRDGVWLERHGLNPTAVVRWGGATTLRVGYEYFNDERVNDRGIPSYQGRPLRTPASTFFGDPDWNRSQATVNSVSALLEHQSGGFLLRNATSFGDYQKYYQNVLPIGVTADASQAKLIAYSSDTGRRQIFNQTEATGLMEFAGIKHELLGGVELGRQATNNFRQRGFFTSLGPDVTTLLVPVVAPTVSVPITLRQRDVDITNRGVAKTVALYVQDQLAFSAHWLAIGGVRLERFDVDFVDDRSAARLASRDRLMSPRAGLIYKPKETVSLYASYTRSYLPRAGEQLSSLTFENQSLEPEVFENYELGAKWEAIPGLTFTAAAYRLDRQKVEVTDAVDPSQSALVDGQQVRGFEAGWAGTVTKSWSMIGGYAYQEGEIKSTQSAAIQAGARLPQLPRHTFSWWNRYEFTPAWGAALGIVYRDSLFASTDDSVSLPGFTRLDAALFVRVGPRVKMQINVENLFNRDYSSMAYSNNNITPGAPRSFRFSVSMGF